MYASLHAHSIFSILDGHALVEDYVAKLKAEGHTHVALTDHGTLAGLPALWKACAKHEMTPIAGMEAYLTTSPIRDRVDESFHLTLLATSRTGYENLMALSSLAWEEGFYRRPRIDPESLAKYSGDLVCLSGCLGGAIPKAIVNKEIRRAEKLLRIFHGVFGERFFLELMNHGDALPEQVIVNRALLEYARRYDIPAVGTNDSHYCASEDYRAYQALTSIQGGPDRKAGSPATWIRSNQEMIAAFGDSALLRNTLAIAEMCEHYSLGSSVPRLPISPWETGNQSPMQVLTSRVKLGLLERLGEPSMDDVDMVYQARMDHELRTIARVSEELGAPLERYFLNVGALAQMMHERQIRFSTRGSAAGSLVCWALGISSLDPIADNLLFERFLNPYRVALPDIDIDVPDNRRDEILIWLKETYGEKHIARIGTYSRIGPKIALKDAARINANTLSREYKLVAAELADLVPHSTNPSEQTLQSVLDEPDSPLLKAMSDPEIAQVVETAKLIAERFRGRSTHAGGVVIADSPISEITPTAQVLRAETAIINHQTQFEMEELEDVGLIKFDLLGLSELSKMEAALDGITALTGHAPDLEDLDWGDAAVWDLICSGDTLGLFQLAGRGMTRLLSRMQPRSLRELAQVIAMFRPGPMANIDEIAARKHGDSPVESLHPTLDHILAPTFGFPIFQEQLIDIAVTVANYAPGEADVLRKAIGKKDPKLMAEKGKEFKGRAAANGYTKDEAEHIWTYIVPFAAYGFNRAHAAVYAAEAYKSAWLKAHYGEIFYAAAMSIEARSGGNGTPQERIGHLAQEARRRGIAILPPDVNASGIDFRAEGHAVRYGLGAIKDLGDHGARGIVECQPFTSLLDLVQKVPKANKKDLVALIDSGATPEWGNRPSQEAYLEQLLDLRKKKQVGQRKAETKEEARARGEAKVAELFAAAALDVPPDLPDMPWLDRLRGELNRLGIIHSPFPAIEGTVKIATLGEQLGHVRIAGVLAQLEPKISRAGNALANVSIIDDTGVIDGMIWPRTWKESNGTIHVGDHVCAIGIVRLDTVWESEETPPPSALRIYIESIAPLGVAPEPTPERNADLSLVIPESVPYDDAVAVLTSLLSSPPGEEHVLVRYCDQSVTIPCTRIQKLRLERTYSDWAVGI